MKKNFRKKWKNLLLMFLMLFLLFSTIYLIFAVILYKGIETKMRIVGCFTLLVALMLLFTLLIKFKKKLKVTIFLILSLISIIYGTGLTVAAHTMNKIYSTIDKMTGGETTETYSASIITLKTGNNKTIEDVKKGSIGMVTSDKDDYEAYSLANLLIDENDIDRKKLLAYDDAIDLINDVLNGKIDYAILPTNFSERYNEELEIDDLEERFQIVKSREETQKVKVEDPKEVKSLDEPFTILIMGVAPESSKTMNSPVKDLRAQGDALIVVTFNPVTTNATILSVPRDTYMPLTCNNNKKRKITDAGGLGGDKCIINSLQNYLELKIDYYVKVNFNAVVKLVDAFGGVEVDVPYAFCEQNSQRKWGSSTVYVKAGKQTLNGEQALAFARHRKTSGSRKHCGSAWAQGTWDDFTRGQQQQAIIKGLLKKFKDIGSFTEIMDLLDILGTNVYTTLPTDSLSELYKLGKNILTKSASAEDALTMQRLYLSGRGTRVWQGSRESDVVVVYDESKAAVLKAMKENLGILPTTPVKKFSFSIKNAYEEYVIGKNVNKTTSIVLMPNLVGKDLDYAKNWASQHNISITINETQGSVLNRITAQSIHEKVDLDTLTNRNLTLTVVTSLLMVPEEPEEPDEPTDPSTPDTGDTEEPTTPEPEPTPTPETDGTN